MGNPRKGGDIWRGEYDAAEVLDWTIETADADGRLRGHSRRGPRAPLRGRLLRAVDRGA
jgi:hypothetical protein